jgi:hypothetical protein
MGRRRIWEVNCFGLDAVLCTTFDPDELRTLGTEFRSADEIPCLSELKVPPSLIVYGVAHKACHSDNPTSRRIERRLDVLHGQALEAAERSDPVDVLTGCYASVEEAGQELAGCLWAVLTDPRTELRQQGLFWVQGLMIRSLTHWMKSREAFHGKAGP